MGEVHYSRHSLVIVAIAWGVLTSCQKGASTMMVSMYSRRRWWWYTVHALIILQAYRQGITESAPAPIVMGARIAWETTVYEGMDGWPSTKRKVHVVHF